MTTRPMPLGIDLESAAKNATEATVVAGTVWGAFRLAMGLGPWVDRRIDARLAPALATIAGAADRQALAADRQTRAVHAIATDVGDLGLAIARIEGVLGEPASANRRDRRSGDHRAIL